MTAFTRYGLAVLAAATTAAARAAVPPADALTELQHAAHELERAALLRDVATGKTELEYLLAARADLRKADPMMCTALRENARRLADDIGRDVGAAATDITAPPPDVLGSVYLRPPLDRSDIGALAQRSEQLLRQAQTC